MKDLGLKQNVLQEIIDMMDEKEGEGLKSHPKLMAAKLEVAKPEVEEMELEPEAEKEPMLEKVQGEDSEISEDDLQKLLAHFKDL